MRVIVAGSRSLDYLDLLDAERECAIAAAISVVISGRAPGIDLAGEKLAAERGHGCEVYPADWKRYGKQAGFRRNEQMAHAAEALLAVWDGESDGTRHMIGYMKSLGKPVYVYTPWRYRKDER